VAPPQKFDAETRARAVRMYEDRLRDHGDSKLAARRHVGGILDINPATLRNWVEGERPHAGENPHGGPDGEVSVEDFRRLQKENAELRRANEILKTASAFFAQAELDRKLK